MSSSSLDALAKSVSFDADNLWVELVDGRRLSVPLAYFPRLAHATSAQRKRFTISGGGIGLHWDQIDEDISVPALLMGKIDRAVNLTSKKKRAA